MFILCVYNPTHNHVHIHTHTCTHTHAHSPSLPNIAFCKWCISVGVGCQYEWENIILTVVEKNKIHKIGSLKDKSFQ